MLLLVVLVNVTIHSFETSSSSILNLLHENVRSGLREQLSKFYTSNLDVNWTQQFHFDHWIFCINVGLQLMLQERLEKDLCTINYSLVVLENMLYGLLIYYIKNANAK